MDAAARSRLQLLLASVPDPRAAKHFLESLRQVSPEGFARIMGSAAALRCAVHLFSYSRFLSESVVQYPERILRVANSGSFYRALSVEDYRERLLRFLGAADPAAVDFARYRRQQLLRILLRDVLGVATLATVTEELSNLADAILDVAYQRIRSKNAARNGEPRLEDGGACGFSVISLGKLGGKELNYSSDIDLMFVYEGNGETMLAQGATAGLTNKEFYKKVANQYTALLSTYTAEGQCYRVDLRLRPDGTELEVFCTGVRNILDVAINTEDELFTYDNTDEHDWMGRLTHMVEGGVYGYPHDFIPRRPYTLWMMADYGGGSPTGRCESCCCRRTSSSKPHARARCASWEFAPRTSCTRTRRQPGSVSAVTGATSPLPSGSLSAMTPRWREDFRRCCGTAAAGRCSALMRSRTPSPACMRHLRPGVASRKAADGCCRWHCTTSSLMASSSLPPATPTITGRGRTSGAAALRPRRWRPRVRGRPRGRHEPSGRTLTQYLRRSCAEGLARPQRALSAARLPASRPKKVASASDIPEL
jgi:hypothetical protein